MIQHLLEKAAFIWVCLEIAGVALGVLCVLGVIGFAVYLGILEHRKQKRALEKAKKIDHLVERLCGKQENN